VLRDGAVATVPIEDYVWATLLSELSPAGADGEAAARMFELQAIVSRTYAQRPRHAREGFDFCSTTHCQLYDPARAAASRSADAARHAVRRTAGVIVWFDGAPASVVFHADCGGHTSAAGDVWRGASPPYLTAQSDDGPAAGAHAAWRFTPADPELLSALNADERTSVGDRLDRIDVLERDAAGRAQLARLDGSVVRVVTGEELRAVIARRFGPRSLRSTRFDVTRTDRGFEFTGRGFGHGVGLCQAGALARIAAGARPNDVLARYFPGTRASR
jgi:stage II sporulation protein D